MAAIIRIPLSIAATLSFEPWDDIQNHELRVSTMHDPPFITIDRQKNGTDKYGGYLYDVWLLIAEHLGLRFKMQSPRDGGYGILNKNGTWSGMVGELVHGRADVALSMLSIRKDRKAVVDFIDVVPVWESSYNFYVHQGSSGTTHLSVEAFWLLLKPLQGNVWWTLLSFMIMLSVVLRVTLRFNHQRAESRRVVEEMGWGSCLMHCFMSLVGQGWTRTPNSLAARIITISIWLLTRFILISYAGELISHLTIREVDKPINSLQEFFERPDWKFAIKPGHVTLGDWKVSDDPYERELYRRSQTKEGFISLGTTDETMQRALQPNVMSYISRRQRVFSIGLEGCHLVPLQEQPAATDRHFIALARGQKKLHEVISRQVLQMKEFGLLSRLQAQWLVSGDFCSPARDVSGNTAGELMSLLMMPPIAVIASLGILGIEKVWRRRST